MATAGRRAVGVLLSAALLLTACTSGGDDSGKDSGASSGAPAGTVRLGLPGPLVVDPAKASLASPPEAMVLDLLYEGLTRLDSKGAAQPALAAKITPNKTLNVWTFALAADAAFSDGTPLTAADVVASLEHVAAGGTGSLQALALEPIAGFAAFVAKKAPHMSGLVAKDAHTVTITTTGPLSVLPTLLASPLLGIVKVSALAGVSSPSDLNALPLSGAWKVEKTADGSATLGPRAKAAGVTAVELHAYSDEGAAFRAFQGGKVDWAAVPEASYQEAVDAYGTKAFAPYQAEVFFGMNLAIPSLRNDSLRAAIAGAIDREAIVDAVYDELADPLATIVPVGVPGHDGTRCSPCEPNPDAAKALVKKTYPDGKVPTITLDYDESPAQSAMAEIVAADLKAIGIPTTLHAMPREDYKRFVVSGREQLFTFGWIGAFVSPDAYLQRLFQSSSNDNLTGFHSSAVDLGLAVARSTTDAAKQQDAWGGVERAVAKAHVAVPIAQFRTQVVVSERVKGWQHAVDGTVDWSAVTVAD